MALYLYKKDKDFTMKRDLLVMGGAMLALGLAIWIVWGNPEIDVFALLVEARQRIASLRAAIEAKRDFWFAQSDLTTAVNGGGGGPGDSPSLSRPSATAQAGGG
jgi:hypothetical protein